MPNKDKTGPNGKGSKTGRQMGNCENVEPIGRCGEPRGGGRRSGRGFRNQPRNSED
ncbi:MAG: DUF5320 domain-containing protein [Nanoarchaeota archaeon]